MSAISSERPVFPPSLKGQGASTATNAARVLKEAQVAFFRPVTNSVATETPTAASLAVEPAPASAPEASAIKRPGFYLDIRV